MLLLPGTVDGHSTGLNLHNLDLCLIFIRGNVSGGRPYYAMGRVECRPEHHLRTTMTCLPSPARGIVLRPHPRNRRLDALSDYP